tara:strand:- start:374 stop:652 length:279 start_codon:yes stop_codon:yes gene_type:complete
LTLAKLLEQKIKPKNTSTMGQEMGVCSNPFGTYDEEEDEDNNTELNREKKPKKEAGGARIHKYDVAARDAGEKQDTEHRRSEGNRYIKDNDL